MKFSHFSGPLSGIFRILDSPRAMKRIQEQEKGPKKVEAKPVTPVAPVQVKTTTVQPVRRPPTAARQQSEDDEIARIKRENKAAGSSTATTETPAERTSILKKPSTEEAVDVSQVL
jgi:tripartite motif-containing protein 71